MTDTLYESLQLAQIRPSNTSFNTAYSSDDPAVITSISICNVSAGTAKASVCIDRDGTTFDETTAIMWGASIPTGTTVLVEVETSLININTTGLSDVTQGSIGVKTDTANALTFTIHGREKRL